MKRFIIFTVLAVMIPSTVMSQDDDLYFTPKKTVGANVQNEYQDKEGSIYHSGSNRDVDEYNRQGKYNSYYQKVRKDSLGNDIIEFYSGSEEYPIDYAYDTVYNSYKNMDIYYSDEFQYRRRMGYFYDWYYPYFYDWHNPYIYSWYNPFFYAYRQYHFFNNYLDWYYNWNYYGWLGDYYGGYYNRNVITGTRNHTNADNRLGRGNYDFRTYRGHNNSSGTHGRFGNTNTFGSRNRNDAGYNKRRGNSRGYANNNNGVRFGGSRSNNNNNNNTHDTPSQYTTRSYSNTGTTYSNSNNRSSNSSGYSGGTFSSGRSGGSSGSTRTGGGTFGGRR